MKIEVKDAPQSQKEITIEIPYETFEQEIDNQTAKLAQTAKVSGFRPGKAPKDVVKKQNLHSIRSAALDELINNAVRDALISNNINPLSQPAVDNMKMEEGEPISFSVFVDVFPDFSVEKTGSFDFDKTIIKISDEDVEDAMVRFREQSAEWQPLKKKRKVKEGDQAVIDYLGKVDGVAFDGGTAEGHTLEIGSGQFIPGFEEGVVGMSVGDVKDITVTFPEQYHAENLAGKDAVFTVTLHEIKEKVTPELDDEFAKKISPRFETLEKFRNAVEKDLQNEADHYMKLETFTKILDKLMEENPFDVPASVAREQAQRMAQQNLQQYYQMGLDPSMFGFSVDAMVMELMPEAAKQVKRALIINKIADDNKFEATEDDIKKEIKEAAELSGRPEEDIEKDIYGNEQYLSSMKNEIISDKVFNFLQGKNKIHETVLTRKEFEAKTKAAEAAKADDSDQEEADTEEKPKKKAASKKAKTEEEDEKPAKKTTKKTKKADEE